MRRTVRVVLGALVVAHGGVHLLGAAAGLGWTSTSELEVTTVGGWAWLAVAAITVAAGTALLAGRPRWWQLGAVAAAGSLALVATHWPAPAPALLPDAALLLAVLHGWWCASPRSLRGRYRTGVAASRDEPTPSSPVSDADVDRLPPVVARYVRRTGAVGRPRVSRVRVRLRGRIRGGPDEPWMTFTGEQVNTYGERPTRHFLLDATRAGLPIDVLHVLTDGTATMQARLLSVIPVVRGAGAEMDRGETVTLFNDLCLLAPAALVDAPVTWEELDDRRVRGTYRTGGQEVSAVLVVDAEGDLRDFVSDDRLRASPDGRSFTPMRWSTPVGGFAQSDGRRLAGSARALWHAPEPEGTFVYAEMELTDIVTDRPEPTSGRTTARRA
ncbi:DUF6544 family protein [Actinotalea sp. K2]|uniref:DUF6544 family protein n=1 Tax=Actinotalea sp. K2 TaxID=2939438 RepID=UPI0020180C0F|nr:DUF6544 family protein [Actinotalea sp. K2]MCL3861166.1 hypothetical protein [Actinotalea sp. K2]